MDTFLAALNRAWKTDMVFGLLGFFFFPQKKNDLNATVCGRIYANGTDLAEIECNTL